MSDPNIGASPRVAVIQHDTDAPLGDLGLALESAGAEIELHPPGPDLTPGEDGIDAIVVLGGEDHPKWSDGRTWLQPERDLVAAADAAGIPVLGICLGGQLISQAFGGDAVEAGQPEFGWSRIKVLPAAAEDPLLAGAPWPETAFSWHYWEIKPAPSAEVLAVSDACVQAFRAAPLVWGTQFHFEASRPIASGWVADSPVETKAQAKVPDGRTRDGDNGPAGPGIPTDLEILGSDLRFARQREFARHVGNRFVEIARNQAASRRRNVA